jgi:hypothetical protein
MSNEKNHSHSDEVYVSASYVNHRRRAARFCLVDLLEAAAAGHVRCIAPSDEVLSWRFHRDDIEALVSRPTDAPFPEKLTLPEAAMLTKFKVKTFSAAIKIGLLQAEWGKKLGLLIRRSDLHRFTDEWASVNHVQAETSLSEVRYRRLLRETGLQKTAVGAETLVRRADLRKHGILPI